MGAFQLDPSAAFLDTLAEVELQRGSQSEAITASRKAFGLRPEKYFKQQLERIEARDRSTPVPE